MRSRPLMRIRFHGAAGEVTGSRHLVEFNGRQVLLDCGMVQGGRNEAARNAAGFGFDPRALDSVVVSHAHIDHIGRLPLLVKRGYEGPIWVTPATQQLAKIMLEDSASLAAADAEKENRGRQRRGEQLVAPLYLMRDVVDTLQADEAAALRRRGRDRAGHDPRLRRRRPHPRRGQRAAARHAERRFAAAGVLRRHRARSMRPSCATRRRAARPTSCCSRAPTATACTGRAPETVKEIGEILAQARETGGNVLIPAFAVGRSQEILYWFARHYDEWKLGEWKIFLDSPMANRVIEVYQRNHGLFDHDAREQLSNGKHPFRLPNLKLVSDVQDSRRSTGATPARSSSPARACATAAASATTCGTTCGGPTRTCCSSATRRRARSAGSWSTAPTS
jgi:metallo-beta-lactamase family protein